MANSHCNAMDGSHKKKNYASHDQMLEKRANGILQSECILIENEHFSPANINDNDSFPIIECTECKPKGLK